MDDTQTTPAGENVGRQVYDMLMSAIEPELVSSVIPTLKAKYKDETPMQKAARGERYREAFKKYDAVYADFIQEATQVVHDSKMEALASAEAKAKEDDTNELNALESQFQS